MKLTITGYHDGNVLNKVYRFYHAEDGVGFSYRVDVYVPETNKPVFIPIYGVNDFKSLAIFKKSDDNFEFIDVSYYAVKDNDKLIGIVCFFPESGKYSILLSKTVDVEPYTLKSQWFPNTIKQSFISDSKIATSTSDTTKDTLMSKTVSTTDTTETINDTPCGVNTVGRSVDNSQPIVFRKSSQHSNSMHIDTGLFDVIVSHIKTPNDVDIVMITKNNTIVDDLGTDAEIISKTKVVQRHLESTGTDEFTKTTILLSSDTNSDVTYTSEQINLQQHTKTLEMMNIIETKISNVLYTSFDSSISVTKKSIERKNSYDDYTMKLLSTNLNSFDISKSVDLIKKDTVIKTIEHRIPIDYRLYVLSSLYGDKSSVDIHSINMTTNHNQYINQQPIKALTRKSFITVKNEIIEINSRKHIRV